MTIWYILCSFGTFLVSCIQKYLATPMQTVHMYTVRTLQEQSTIDRAR
jgi:hypothetical protein